MPSAASAAELDLGRQLARHGSDVKRVQSSERHSGAELKGQALGSSI